jgi:hypothetical protein
MARPSRTLEIEVRRRAAGVANTAYSLKQQANYPFTSTNLVGTFCMGWSTVTREIDDWSRDCGSVDSNHADSVAVREAVREEEL